MSEVIDNLVDDLTAVKRLSSPVKTAAAFAALTLLLPLSILVLFYDLRGDFESLMAEKNYIVSNIGLFALATTSAMAVALARVPGASRAPARLSTLVLMSLIAALVGLGGASDSKDPVEHLNAGILCSDHVLFLAIPAFLLGFWLLRAGAPVNPLMAAFWVSVFSISVGALLLPLACTLSAPVHLLVSHLLAPLSVIALLAALLSRNILRWE